MMMMMIVDLYSALRRAPLLLYVSWCIVKSMSSVLIDVNYVTMTEFSGNCSLADNRLLR